MRLAADTNVILSALRGGAAGRILEHPDVEVFTARTVIDEVEEYIPEIASRKGLDPALLYITLVHMPLVILEPQEYRGRVEEARRRIERRDSDDVDLLAVALTLRIPVWSNDNDFEDSRIEWYTTAEVLKKLK